MQIILLNPTRDSNYVDLIEFCAARGIELVEVKFTDTQSTNSAMPTFPSLDECKSWCRGSLSYAKLTEHDEHMIGTVWAFIERELRQ